VSGFACSLHPRVYHGCHLPRKHGLVRRCECARAPSLSHAHAVSRLSRLFPKDSQHGSRMFPSRIAAEEGWQSPCTGATWPNAAVRERETSSVSPPPPPRRAPWPRLFPWAPWLICPRKQLHSSLRLAWQRGTLRSCRFQTSPPKPCACSPHRASAGRCCLRARPCPPR